jgi:hypothetical protein
MEPNPREPHRGLSGAYQGAFSGGLSADLGARKWLRRLSVWARHPYWQVSLAQCRPRGVRAAFYLALRPPVVPEVLRRQRGQPTVDKGLSGGPSVSVPGGLALPPCPQAIILAIEVYQGEDSRRPSALPTSEKKMEVSHGAYQSASLASRIRPRCSRAGLVLHSVGALVAKVTLPGQSTREGSEQSVPGYRACVGSARPGEGHLVEHSHTRKWLRS